MLTNTRSLANLQIRLTLAHLLWAFEMSLSEECNDWDIRQPFATVWHRLPLSLLMRSREPA